MLVLPTFDTDIAESVVLGAASINPPEFAGVELAADHVVVRPLQVGTATLQLTLADGKLMARRLRFAAIASTTIVVDDVPAGAGDFAVLAGSTLQIHAEHRDAAGELLLGGGLDAWGVAGGTLVPDARFDPIVDDGLGRALVAPTAGTIAVSAGPGSTLALDVVPAGSTRLLVVDTAPTGTLAMSSNELVGAELRAFDAQHRVLIGGGPVDVAIDDPRILEITVRGRHLSLSGKHVAGSTHVVLHLDGRTLVFDVELAP